MKFLIVFVLALSLSAASAFRVANSKLGITKGWCGGTLIGSQWVLSGAQCTTGITLAIVYLGATERSKPEKKYTIKPKDVINHPDWNRSTKENDISLIKIPATTDTANIKAIALPSISGCLSTYVGIKVVASGWGYDSDFNDKLTYHLQWAQLQVIDNSECCTDCGYTVTSTKLCVSTSGGVSTCTGDTGGPLVSVANNVLVGVTSYDSTRGCTKGNPAAFTRVSSYLSWIQKETGISY